MQDVAVMTPDLQFWLAGYARLCLDSPVFAVQHNGAINSKRRDTTSAAFHISGM
jgi:hypothetical protein